MRSGWKGKHYSFYQNKECEYFPCHSGLDKAEFNCLFCYCPLYTLGRECGGNYRYTANGIKDCTNCSFPHRKDNYGEVTGKFKKIVEMMNHEGLERDNS